MDWFNHLENAKILYLEEIQQPQSAIYEGGFESYQCEVRQASNACSFVESCEYK